MRTIGIVLLVVGIIVIVLPFIPFTRTETVVDIGPIEATSEKEDRVNVPAWVGGLIFAGGVTMLAISAKERLSS